MRTESISITADMTFTVGKPDLNGVTYTREAVVNAIRELKDIPITCDGKPIGVAEVAYVSSEQEDSVTARVFGKILFGGTCCTNVLFDDRTITSYEITEVGLCGEDDD